MSTQRWVVRLAKVAKVDLREILAFSRAKFGAAQTRNYAQTIDDAVRTLRAGREVLGSRMRRDLGQGLRSLHIARKGRRGRHVLIYRIATQGTIEIVRILHESMDLGRHVAPLHGNEEN